MSSFALMRAQRQPIPLPTASFAGQTVIVTGSNTGLGLEAAKHFVRLDAARVVLAVRSPKKGEDAKTSIEEATKRTNVVEVWQVDMDKYDSIKAFAARCDTLDRLDAVCLNAGILRNTYELAEGTEISIAVNVIGTFLLALNLLPVLRRSGAKTGRPSRMVITSSVVHEDAKFKERHEPAIFEAFKKDNQAYLDDRYNTSKLLEVLLVRSVADAMNKGPHAAEPVIFNNVNPGLCQSDLFEKVEGMAAHILTLARALLARTTEVGSRTLVFSAAAGPESHGKYMSECKVKDPSSWVRSKDGAATQERVHKELMDILEGIQPGITANI